MKLIIKREILLESLNHVSKALSNKNIIPVLNGIKFELSKKGLTLITTDSDITIKSFIDKKDIKEIGEEGELIIVGRYLIDIVRKLTEDEISIEDWDNTKAIITTSSSKYNLNCYDLEDFPKIELEDSDVNFKLDTEVFRNIIYQTAFATSTQESRPFLTGINIKINNSKFICTATDAYRLSTTTLDLGESIKDNINIIIPSHNVNELIKLLDDDNEVIELHVLSNKVLFKYKSILFQSSLLNGSYPDTDNMIPKEFDLEVEVPIKELYNSIDRASLLTQAKEKNIISLEIESNNILITSSSAEIGKVEENISCVNQSGKSIKIAFSAKYMLEALKILSEDNILLLLNGEISPIIIREKNNSNLTELILPIKTY